MSNWVTVTDYFKRLLRILSKDRTVRRLTREITDYTTHITAQTERFTTHENQIRLRDRLNIFSESPHEAESRAAQAQLAATRPKHTLAQQMLQSRIRNMVWSHVRTDTPFAPIHLLERFNELQKNTLSALQNVQGAYWSRPAIQRDFKDFKSQLHQYLGRTPTVAMLVDALYLHLKQHPPQ